MQWYAPATRWSLVLSWLFFPPLQSFILRPLWSVLLSPPFTLQSFIIPSTIALFAFLFWPIIVNVFFFFTFVLLLLLLVVLLLLPAEKMMQHHILLYVYLFSFSLLSIYPNLLVASEKMKTTYIQHRHSIMQR